MSSREAPQANLRNYVVCNLRDIERKLQSILLNYDQEEVDHILYKLEQIVYVVVNSHDIWNLDDQFTFTLIEAYNLLRENLEQKTQDNIYERKVEHMGQAGRPAFVLPEETLRLYLTYGFTNQKIAEIFQVSPKTVRRRIVQFGLDATSSKYSDISNDDLDKIISEIKENFPNCGIRRMKGFLTAQGIKVQWERVRKAMWRVDPEGILLRTMQLNIVSRRHYYVPGPLALWHIDGNHKLIRWGFVFHGCVDGYSRKIMFLSASTSNKAKTVMNLFLNAVQVHGLPSRVRGDQGVENVDVAWHMFSHPARGPGCGSFIAGKGCHNQRIERFWRDLFHGCTFLFYYIFTFLEGNGHLNLDDSLHIFCLHYVFLPRINQQIKLFKQGYNNHPIRTESNMTPNQLAVWANSF